MLVNRIILPIGTLLIVVSMGMLSAHERATVEAKDALEEIASDIALIGGKLTYGKVLGTLYGEVTVDDVVIKYLDNEVMIDSVYAKGFSRDINNVDDIELSLDNISFNNVPSLRIDEKPDSFKDVIAYAITHEGKKVDIDLALHVSPETGEFDVSNFSVDGEDLATVSARGQFVSQSLIAGGGIDSPIELEDFSVTLSDDGMVSRLFVERGGPNSIQREREKIIVSGEAEANKATGIVKEITQGFVAFVQGKDITLRRDNVTPVSVKPSSALSDIQELKKFSEDASMTVEIN